MLCYLFWQQTAAQKLIKVLSDRLKQEEEETLKLKELNALEKTQEEQIQIRYEELIKELKAKHQLEILHISEQKEKEVKELIKKYKDNPDAQASHLRELFGI